MGGVPVEEEEFRMEGVHYVLQERRGSLAKRQR